MRVNSQNGTMDSPDPIDIEVGMRLRVRRKQLGVSQPALAEHLGVTFQQVQKYERGANRISASMLVRAAEKLGTSVADLVGEGEGAVEDSGVLAMLASSGAMDLLKAFTAIEDLRVRTAILELVRATGAGGGGAPTAGRR
jgi:transcriptional regulator with XRE-family HTH domain